MAWIRLKVRGWSRFTVRIVLLVTTVVVLVGVVVAFALFFGVLFTASATIVITTDSSGRGGSRSCGCRGQLSSVIFSTRISPGAVTTVITGTDALSRRVALVLLSPNGSWSVFVVVYRRMM